MHRLTNSLIGGCTVVAGRYHRWRQRQATIRELSALEDHILKDIGVCRYDIPLVAEKGDGANQSRRVWPGKPCT